MKDILIKWFMAFNTFLLRISRGRIASKLGTQAILILHTVGHKSGQPRAIPIAYFRDGKNFFVIGSNWGREKHADWYINLKHEAHASLELDGTKTPVLAHDAENEEYARLWQNATRSHPHYNDYQKMTARHIPIVVFEPQETY